MQHKYDQKPQTQFTSQAQEALSQMRQAEYCVLVGRNNTGKSFVLKNMAQQWGIKASYIGPARYQNFNLLGAYAPNDNAAQQKFQNFVSEFANQHQNIDNSSANLQQSISELSDNARSSFIEVMKTLLNADIEILNTVPDNSMSQKFVSCNGHNISYTSSGLRLVATLITSLLNPSYDTYLVDEPELGISPETQGILADFLFNHVKRQKYFPHIKTLVMATHSTVFLDHKCILNNYAVSKDGLMIDISSVTTQAAFNQIHFLLLGNRFETLYLPSCIVLVEGKTDHKFLERLFAIKYNNFKISIVPANTDSRIKEILNIAKGLFSDFHRSPYKDRIYIVLDATHTKGLPGDLTRMGITPENVVVWPKNGIEYYYPNDVMDNIYGAGGSLIINGDSVTRNGISFNKTELVDKVINLMQTNTAMHPDLETIFLKKIGTTLGVN